MALAGKTVAFTGEMVGMTRKEASAIAQAAGAAIGSATSKNIDFLFAGSGATPAKTMKAQQNGVSVMAAPQFSQMTAGYKAAAPMAAAPMYSAPAPVVQYPTMMNKAPRGRRPAAAVQTYAAPAPQAYSAPAPVAAFTNNAVTLPGKSLTFTGSLETATRAEAAAMATQAGATVSSVITPQTSYLVCGANPGQTKLIASQAAGVANISEGQFMKAAIPAVNAMPETAAPAMTYTAPTMMSTRGRKPRADAAPMAYAPAPVAYEAPTTGAMPWEIDVVGEAPAPKMRAPRMATPAPVAAPAMTYTAPAPKVRAPRAVATPMAQTGTVSLAGQNVVFTGALQVSRVVAATMVSKAGGVAQSALSPKTNLLVCGANAGEKMAKAQAMGVRCINEAEFVGACTF